jgi:hypothetical protein
MGSDKPVVGKFEDLDDAIPGMSITFCDGFDAHRVCSGVHF